MKSEKSRFSPRLLLTFLLFAHLVFGAEPPARYLDACQPIKVRVEDMLSRMTLEEKLSQVHADSKFTTAAIPRLSLPRRWLSDGPHGVREEVGPDTWAPAGRTDDFATSLPVEIALASTWNPELAYAYGAVVGQEARQRGKDIILGPNVNIQRTPLNGRSFEGLGEDPWLVSRLAVNYIRGVQAQEVAACVKHFAANNQETDRFSVEVEMEERTLREIYLPAFQAAVQEAGVLTVMGAYNKFRGQFCCENDLLLNQILKKEWGFQGLVVSDWAGTHHTREAVRHGLDLEMGTDKPYEDFYLARPFLDGIKQGEYPQALLDDKVRRNLRVMFATHVFDRRAPGSLNTPQHQATARRVAEEGIVLLKNEGALLPLDPTKIKSLAVIGENAIRRFAAGGGSSGIKAFYEVTPLEGIVRCVGEQVNVDFSMGYHQPPRLQIGAWDTAGVATTEVVATESRNAADYLERAVQAASQADVVVIVAGLSHARNFDTEGTDREDLKLPYGQDELIQRVLAANPQTVVVVTSGAPVEMDAWAAQVPAIIQAWYSGMEGGNALAGVLFGDVNPSGKLPCTFPRHLADSPAHALGAYPGQNGTVRYAEGLLVGYRYYDTKNMAPLFPFGHGLSYTTFDYSNLRLVAGKGTNAPLVTVELEVTNTGQREGSEVVQVYLHPSQPSLPRPDQELKGFQKVRLKPGEKKQVTVPLPLKAFAFYDPVSQGWSAEKGGFTIRVGGSSRDIRLSSSYQLEQTTVIK